MKTIHHVTSALVAAGSAGVALLTVSGLVPAELGFAGFTVVGLAGFALSDYARPLKPLHAAVAPVLRPPLPAATRSNRRVSAIVEKVA